METVSINKIFHPVRICAHGISSHPCSILKEMSINGRRYQSGNAEEAQEPAVAVRGSTSSRPHNL